MAREELEHLTKERPEGDYKAHISGGPRRSEGERTHHRSLERKEAKETGLLPNWTRRGEGAFFLGLALTDHDVKMHEPDEGIQLANRFISYLEVLQALTRLEAHVQAAMIAYFGDGISQERVAERFRVSERTVRSWKGRGRMRWRRASGVDRLGRSRSQIYLRPIGSRAGYQPQFSMGWSLGCSHFVGPLESEMRGGTKANIQISVS